MEDRKNTDKQLLMKGVKLLAGSLPLAVIGPTILFSSFKNQEHVLFIPVLGFALLVMAGSVFLMFRGLSVVMKSMFD